MANVTLKDVYKSFGKNEVIHGINCEIKSGEFMAILGPSGCLGLQTCQVGNEPCFLTP